MKEIIGWVLVALSCLGALYATGLIISYILLPKDLNDVTDYCGCDKCQN